MVTSYGLYVFISNREKFNVNLMFFIVRQGLIAIIVI
jgi:hypothetical protein